MTFHRNEQQLLRTATISPRPTCCRPTSARLRRRQPVATLAWSGAPAGHQELRP